MPTDDSTRQLPTIAAPLLPDVLRAELEDLHRRAIDFESDSISTNTRSVYESAWKRFAAWCARRERDSLPADSDTVRLYATAAVEFGIELLDGTPALKPLKPSSLTVHLAAITFVHDHMGHPNPVTEIPRAFLKGLRNRFGAPPDKKTWVSQRQLRSFVEALPEDLKGIRDRAILLVAFDSGGRRRSEIAGMRLEHIKQIDNGWLWTMPRSKTDQEGRGTSLHIPKLRNPAACPARALSTWIQAANVTDGFVFRSVDRHGRTGNSMQPRVVAMIVKDAARHLGLNPDDFGGHSLRSGFATDMARKGLRTEDIMMRTKHKSLQTLHGYIQMGHMLADDDPVVAALNGRGDRDD